MRQFGVAGNDMRPLAERVVKAEREIAAALAESQQPHTEAEHVGILLWEMDWLVTREQILEELAAQQRAA